MVFVLNRLTTRELLPNKTYCKKTNQCHKLRDIFNKMSVTFLSSQRNDTVTSVDNIITADTSSLCWGPLQRNYPVMTSYPQGYGVVWRPRRT
ncbi:hypothetical protein JTE90_006823 [Oedothorax gibbosus]|uniref:Uncharacterized protein n=1 Tax=Oedothorax gibbosus TaxID=931172 RepID=A0AAV6U6K3_9ARAC|nr:hypothetical protein JTE90_006823 [Oedothorax gibbosus]